jgi:Mg2+ and Co2+ transporter CorA
VNNGIRPDWTFWVLGLGSLVGTCAILYAFFKRKGWM